MCAADLKFATSSRMKRRWLVIAGVLPSGDVMYLHYTVPTIVMSRACDQLAKVGQRSLSVWEALACTFAAVHTALSKGKALSNIFGA